MQQYSKVYNCREVPPQELQPPTALQETAFFKTRRPRVGEGRQVTIFLMLLTVYNLDSFSLFALPYRLIYAVATQNAIMFYDTQQVSKSLNKKQKLGVACQYLDQATPFGRVSNIHYTGLTDLAWSPCGNILVVSR